MSNAVSGERSYRESRITFVGCPIEIWGDETPATLTIEAFEEIELPPIAEVDAWQAVEDLEAEAAAASGLPPWSAARGAPAGQAGVARPATVSAIAALLLVLAMVHGLGALGSLSLGLNGRGIGSAVVVGLLALTVGVGEVVCAVQVTRGKAWSRVVVGALGLLVLFWLTMAPWSPGSLTVAVFAAWLIIGGLLAHPLTSRFFADTRPAPTPA
ncbi:MAG: hypothetical protein LBD70_02610 [Bifidobacteriaceae bacterium]|nr:hypothetical protein [Bifidobacteriaceae bacterium]